MYSRISWFLHFATSKFLGKAACSSLALVKAQHNRGAKHAPHIPSPPRRCQGDAKEMPRRLVSAKNVWISCRFDALDWWIPNAE